MITACLVCACLTTVRHSKVYIDGFEEDPGCLKQSYQTFWGIRCAGKLTSASEQGMQDDTR